MVSLLNVNSVTLSVECCVVQSIWFILKGRFLQCHKVDLGHFWHVYLYNIADFYVVITKCIIMVHGSMF